ncbi:MAG: hypothetical protein EOO03_05420, partial [Chitinophagaceae bacterium]
MNLPRIYAVLLCLLAFKVGWSQSGERPLSNLRQRLVNTTAPSTRLDSLSIVPNTLVVADVPATNYVIDLVNATITWLRPPLQPVVLVSYRVFPYKLNAVAQRFNYDSIRNNFLAEKPLTVRNSSKA